MYSITKAYNHNIILKDAQLILFTNDNSVTLAAKDKNILKLNMYIKN